MSISQVLEQATAWLGWAGLGLAVITIISFIFNLGFKFRLVGATIFTLLLSASCWAFGESYRPPFKVEGAEYAPVVYDNGIDLVVAQAPEGFPNEAIQPTLEQIAGNLKGMGRNRTIVNVRIRKLEPAGEGISKPIILGEAIRDVNKNKTIILFQENSQQEAQEAEEAEEAEEAQEAQEGSLQIELNQHESEETEI